MTGTKTFAKISVFYLCPSNPENVCFPCKTTNNVKTWQSNAHWHVTHKDGTQDLTARCCAALCCQSPCSPAQRSRTSSASLLGLWINPQSFSLPPAAESQLPRHHSVSHPGRSLSAGAAWRAAVAPRPHCAARCPPCRGCADGCSLSPSPEAGIWRWAPVVEPASPQWRSSRSSPTPSPGRRSRSGARASLTRARLSQGGALLGWRRPARSGRPPPPRAHPATCRELWKYPENLLHTGVSAGDLRGGKGQVRSFNLSI